MALIMLNGVAYSTPLVEIQNNSSATSLDALKIPTGQTIESYLNSKTYPNVVISNVDLNTVKTTGIYRLNGSITNSAYGNYGVLQVYATDTTVRQVQYTENPDDIYTRVFYNNAWTTWKKMVNVDYLNNNLPHMITIYSGADSYIEFTPAEYSRYGILIFGGANGFGSIGAITIESTLKTIPRTGVIWRATGNPTTMDISYNSTTQKVHVDGLVSYSYYTLISPYGLAT